MLKPHKRQAEIRTTVRLLQQMATETKTEAVMANLNIQTAIGTINVTLQLPPGLNTKGKLELELYRFIQSMTPDSLRKILELELDCEAEREVIQTLNILNIRRELP